MMSFVQVNAADEVIVVIVVSGVHCAEPGLSWALIDGEDGGDNEGGCY